jgi:eukaryotic-like serine/threonine-protein kinase
VTDRFEAGELVVGRYRVVSTLGSGGMADVYLAEDLKLGRKVALKVLLRRYAGDAQFVERFRREAQAAAQINHPNIVGIYDWGAIGETYYIVMEYVQGETLKDHIRRDGRMSPSQAAAVALGLLAAVDTAHRAGVIHRDIKSQNILLDPSGAVKVTDFGIAKAGDSQMTEAGSILGTAQYLAPEQAKGLAVDERSDLYSVGVVLYEMLTGQVPFQGDSAVTVALKHVNELPPEPAELVPGLPYALNQIVLKALAKDPDHRYASATEFAADLKSAKSGGPLLAAAFDPSLERTQVAGPLAVPGEDLTRVMPARRATTPPRKKKRAWPWVVLALFVVAAVVAAGLLYRSCSSSGVTVPSVVNLSEQAAKAKLEAAGFKVKARDVYSDDVQTGFVARQDPEGGAKVAEGETVDIYVCRGPQTITLRDFRGWTAAEVTTWLEQNGLVAAPKSGPSTSVAKGKVYKQDPAPDSTLERGGTVTFWVSQGKPQVEVPDVTGMTLNGATSTLQDAGFRVGIVTPEASSTVPNGSVISQDPAAGDKVEKGATIDLVVSNGPSPSPSPSPSASASLVAVPDVVGMLGPDAEDALTTLGFFVAVKPKPSVQPPGTVIDQKPDPGTMLPTGSTVTIRVAT